MRTLIRSALALLLVLPAAAGAQTLTFEGLGPDQSPIPNGYGGVNWSNMYVLNGNHLAGTGYQNGIVSGTQVAYNGNGLEGMILEASSPFTLNSGYFTAAWNDGLTLRVTGYVGGSATFFQSVLLDVSGPSYLTFDWAGLDRVSFVSSGGIDHSPQDNGAGTHFVVDDLTLNAVVTTPEPASLALLGTGLVGVFGVTARRRRA